MPRDSFFQRTSRMATPLQAKVHQTLERFRHPRTGRNLLESEAVRDIATTTTGKVRLTLLLQAGDDPELARMLRQTLETVEGVTEVTVDVGDAAQFAANRKSASRALPVMDSRPAQQARVPAPTPVAYPNLGRIIAVS